MALFSIVWKKMAKSHIYQFVMESMIFKCNVNKSTTVGYCLSQYNFRGAHVLVWLVMNV